jgi:tetratricopeptide (TPR) repeat protein
VHAAVARTLADHRRERLDENAALLAQHWEAAGEALEAARWHARAAAWSGFGDPTASLRHWRTVRELVDTLPDSEEATALGINARIFALQYGWRLGITSAEAEELFREAEEMALRLGDIRARATLLMAYGMIRGSGDGDVEEYAKLVRESVALAEETADPALYMSLAFGAYALSIVGDYRDAIEQLDRALELADGDTSLGAGVAVGCPYAYCLIFKGGFLAVLGEWSAAGRLLEAGMKLAGEQKDIETVGWGHMWSGFLCFLRGESDALFGHAQQAIEIAERMGGAFSRAWAWQWFGTAATTREEWEQAIEALERGRAISAEGRTAVEIEPLFLATLAESLLGIGDHEAALAKATSGVKIARERGARGFADLALLAQARVLLASESPEADAAARTTLSELLALVREVGAKGWEPTIHTELAELARRRGDEDGRERELRIAQQLYEEMNAAGQPAAADTGAASESI